MSFVTFCSNAFFEQKVTKDTKKFSSEDPTQGVRPRVTPIFTDTAHLPSLTIGSNLLTAPEFEGFIGFSF